MKDGRVIFFNCYEKIVTRPDEFLSLSGGLVAMRWQRLRVKEKIQGPEEKKEEEEEEREEEVVISRE